MSHGTSGVGNTHGLQNWVYADATARESAAGLVADDIGRFARQEDNGSYWELVGIGPTEWRFGFGNTDHVIAGMEAAIGTKVADIIPVTVQFKNPSGGNVPASGRQSCWLWFCDAAAIAFALPTTIQPDFVSTTDDGTVVSLTGPAGRIVYLAIIDSGNLALEVEFVGTRGFYLIVQTHDGSIVISDIIDFAL